MAKKSKLKSAGRFGVRYGQSVKRRIAEIEAKQHRKQSCIFCNGKCKRSSKGIWNCQKCGKKFAGHAYFLERTQEEILNERLAETAKQNKKDASKVLNSGKSLEKPKKERKTKHTKEIK